MHGIFFEDKPFLHYSLTNSENGKKAIKLFLRSIPFHTTKPRICNVDLRCFIKIQNVMCFVTCSRPHALFYNQ